MPCGGGTQDLFTLRQMRLGLPKPQLKWFIPFPYDVKGLLNASINDPNPVMFFEHKQLYRSVYQGVPKIIIPSFRKAALLKQEMK
jgi:2-oxoisovalerate dehydrogenase E1 component